VAVVRGYLAAAARIRVAGVFSKKIHAWLDEMEEGRKHMAGDILEVRARPMPDGLLHPLTVAHTLGYYIVFGIGQILPALLMRHGPGEMKLSLCLPLAFVELLSRYIVIRRNGVANELQSLSRNFEPVVIFDDLKYVRW
jgi:hypothetical protein